MKKYFSIAIDGPSAAGKSTLAKKIANELKFTYIDTGAMYRSVALFAKRNNVDFKDFENINKLLPNIDINLQNGKVFLNNEDVTDIIRQNEFSMGASTVSQNHQVRLTMVSLQRKMAQKSNVVMDGRDIGSFVLPDADLKIFLKADVKRRAERRYLENLQRGIKSNLDDIEKDLIQRDYNDTHRDFAPLVKTKDAIEVDTSVLDVNETFNEVLNIVKNKINLLDKQKI